VGPLANAHAVVVRLEGRATALDPRTGEARFHVEGRPVGLAREIVLVETEDLDLIAHDALSGTERWRVPLEVTTSYFGLNEAIATEGDVVYLWDGRTILRRRLSSGQSPAGRFAFDWTPPAASPSPALWGGRAPSLRESPPFLLACPGYFAVGFQNRPYAIASAEDGSVIGDVPDLVALDADGMLVRRPSGYTIERPEDGDATWESPGWPFRKGAPHPFALAPSCVVFGERSGGPHGPHRLLVYDRKEPRLRGEHALDMNRAPPVVARDVIYGCTTKAVFACDPDGRELWSWAAPEDVERLAPTPGGLLVGTPREVIALG
jgi:outer membrane protein assembly factor BamB